MKKLFLSLVAAIVAATATYAQSSLVATLSHEGQISTYYGISALRNAYNDAAESGDIITLSSGTFTAVDIAKSLTIRGAGMGVDSKTLAEPTILLGDFRISGNIQKLNMEGIYHNNTITINSLSNSTFLKCRFNEIKRYFTYSTMDNLTFVHCRVAGRLQISDDASVSCVNSIVTFPENQEYGKSSFEFTNCVVYRGKWAAQDLYRAYFKNSILVETTAVSLPESSAYYNTLGVYTDGDADIFSTATNTTNKQVMGFENVFKTFRGSYSDSENYELTDEAKAQYLGNDNTEVGIYGGNMPYDGTPTNPQITKCNVAAKTTADGKLSVDIEVNSAQ
jgi:hypothetical protein